MRYRKKPVVVEAITFDELVQYGIDHGANIVGGMPWSFVYHGYSITHENDNCYIIETVWGSVYMTREDMLVTDGDDIYVCSPSVFAKNFEYDTKGGN